MRFLPILACIFVSAVSGLTNELDQAREEFLKSVDSEKEIFRMSCQTAIRSAPDLEAEDKLRTETESFLKSFYRLPEHPAVIDNASKCKVAVRSNALKYKSRLDELLKKYSERKERELYDATKKALDEFQTSYKGFLDTTIYELLKPGMGYLDEHARIIESGEKNFNKSYYKVKWVVVEKSRGKISLDIWVGSTKQDRVQCEYKNSTSGFYKPVWDPAPFVNCTAFEGGGVKLINSLGSNIVNFELERGFDRGFFLGKGTEFIQFECIPK